MPRFLMCSIKSSGRSEPTTLVIPMNTNARTHTRACTHTHTHITFPQAHKHAERLEHLVEELCSRVRSDLEDGSLSFKEANKLIVKMGDVSTD